MPRRRNLVRLAVFVLTVLVVVAGASAGPYLDSLSQDQSTQIELPEYEVESLSPDAAPATGKISVESADDTGLVLIDQAHTNRYESDEIQPLVAAITAAGYDVEFVTRTDDFDRELSRADALVVIDPGSEYSQSEVDSVESFVDSGGRLLMMGEPTRGAIQQMGFFAAIVQVRNQLTPLSSRFGIQFGEANLYNMQSNDGNYLNVFAKSAGSSRITRGVDTVAGFTATSVDVRDGRSLLVATDGTRSARDDDTGTYPIAVRSGNVVAIGDTTFLRRGNYNVEDNEQLLSNLVQFLVSGDRSRTLASYPGVVSADATITYTSPSLLSPAQRLAIDLRTRGSSPAVRLKRTSVSAEETDVLITTVDHLQSEDGPVAGVNVGAGRLAAQGYESNATGVVMVRAPRRGYDLVIIADKSIRADRAVSHLTHGEIEDFLIADRTAVIRTSAAIPEEDTEESVTGTPMPSTGSSASSSSVPSSSTNETAT